VSARVSNALAAPAARFLARARRRPTPPRVRGVSYVEVLVATMLVAVTLVPMLEALPGGVQASRVHENTAARSLRAASRMEEVLSEGFSALDAAALAAGGPAVPSSYSDAPGTTDRRVVYLSRYDGDDADADGNGFTGTDEGLLWVRVEIEGAGHGLASLVAR